VIIGGMPAARLLELCHHEGHTLGGASEVFIGGPTVDPPNIEQIVRNVEEIDRILRRAQERLDRKKLLDDYLKGPPELSPAEAAALKLLEKWSKHGEGMPPGATDMSGEEARTAKDASDERAFLVSQMAKDAERVQQLKRENEELQRGRSVPPTPPPADWRPV
jgi:hypothetical protein